MTQSEHYFNRRYHHHLREFNNPTVNSIQIRNKPASAEEAAVYNAQKDMLRWQQSQRKIVICCKDMATNQDPMYDLETGEYNHDPIGILPHLVKGKIIDPPVSLGGNILTYCPWCTAKIVVAPFEDKKIPGTGNDPGLHHDPKSSVHPDQPY